MALSAFFTILPVRGTRNQQEIPLGMNPYCSNGFYPLNKDNRAIEFRRNAGYRVQDIFRSYGSLFVGAFFNNRIKIRPSNIESSLLALSVFHNLASPSERNQQEIPLGMNPYCSNGFYPLNKDNRAIEFRRNAGYRVQDIFRSYGSLFARAFFNNRIKIWPYDIKSSLLALSAFFTILPVRGTRNQQEIPLGMNPYCSNGF